MKKVLTALLVFATVAFAAKADKEGDVLLASPYKVDKMAAVAAGIEGFDVGAKASAEIVRDLWVGSDFDQDGQKEVILASYGPAGTGVVYVYEITGDNTSTLLFQTEVLGSDWGGTRHASYGDLDGNGMQELLVSVNSSNDAVGGIWAYEYDTVGDSMRAPVQLFKALVTADRWFCENFNVGDVDQDGVQEIFFGNNGTTNATDNFHIASVDTGTTFAENNITTTIEFTHGKTSATFPIGGSPYGGVIADMNGDGMNEVLFAPWDHGAMLIVENDSVDSYTAVNYIQTDLDRVDDFAFWDFMINDLDGDGRDEAYLSMYSGGRLYVTTCPEGTALADLTTANVYTIDDLGTSGGVATQMGDLDGNGRMNIYASGGGSYLTNHEFIGTDPTDSTHWVKMDNITSASFKGVYGMRYAGDLDGDGYDEIYGANTAASLIAASAIENIPPVVPAVFFSEYIEGSGNNKAIEIYNGTDAEVNLDDFRIAQSVNGGGWEYYHTFPVGATLAAGDVWVILNNGSDSALVDYLEADEVLGYPSVVHHSGDDARAVQWAPNDSTWYTVDVIGWPTFDPGSAWAVAGIDYATANHTLIRKRSVVKGNMDWADAAGTSTSNSEWEVFPQNNMIYLGEHPSNDDADGFVDGNRVFNWISANSGWTSRIWADGDTTLMLSDAGWTIDARRPVYATPGTFFKASALIKTGSFDTSPSQFLTFGVEGIAASKMEVSCISEDGFTEYTVIGYAENAEGTLFINGQGAGGADTVWIDEYTFEDDYMNGLALSTVAEARLIADGDMVATKGIVTVSTQFGYAGPVYIQDETAGIAVYGASVAQNVSDGDEIIVVGEIDIYNGLVEVSGTPELIVLSSGNSVEAVEVTYDDIKDAESYEGQLVVMKGCDTLAVGLDWAATEGSNKGFDLLDKNDSTFYCYVDKDTDIDGSPKPLQWPINITGIVGDYLGAQLLVRSLADFNPNIAPADFMILNPADGAVISGLDAPELEKIEMGGDSVTAMFVNWTEAVDPDAGDTVTYKMVFIGDGSEEEITSVDTFMYIPINEVRPYDMNGVYTYYFEATDLSGGTAMSDTHTITFDFPAPPKVVSAVVTLMDGVPTYYAEFDLPLDGAAISNFSILDLTAPGVITPTAVDSIAPNAVMISAPFVEDNRVALVYNGLTTPGATISITDTTMDQTVLIPFSANHPEDAGGLIEDFEGTLSYFDLSPTYSGSTSGITDASELVTSDEEAYEGTKSGKLTLVDDPAVDGGFFVREYVKYPYVKTVKANSVLLLMVKGSGQVDLALTVKDDGYERQMWNKVTLCETDWQVVSFDLANDPVEGWVNGNGTITGETVTICDLQMKSSTDEDVVLYLDGFTERSATVAVTFNTLPEKFVLHQNYPNPFNPTTHIQFDLPKAVDVKLVIYDIMGRKITTLVNTHMEAGYKNIVWNGTNDYGNKISSGIYIYRIIAGNNIETMKMSYIK